VNPLQLKEDGKVQKHLKEEDWPGTFHICCSKVSFSSLPISLIGSEEFKRLEEVAKLARTSS